MRTRSALLACLLALPPALARSAGTITFTETSTSTGGGLSDGVVNIAECNGTATPDSLALSWTLGSAPTTTVFYEVYATTGSCVVKDGTWPPTSGVHFITNGPVQTTSQSGSQTGIGVYSDLAQTGLLTCSSGGTATLTFCVTVFSTASTASAILNDLSASGTVKFDGTTPGQPTGVSAASGDGALTVSWTDGSPAASTWKVKAEPCTVGATATVTKDCSSSGCRIGGLTNDACYDVTVTGYSKSNNPSIPSDAVSATPHSVDSFWDTYQRAGGREQGGCSGGSASALALLVLATAAPRLRRRRS